MDFFVVVVCLLWLKKKEDKNDMPIQKSEQWMNQSCFSGFHYFLDIALFMISVCALT